MLCSFLVYSKVIQLYVCLCVCVCIIFFRFFSVLVYYKILNIVPCAVSILFSM